MCRDSTGCCLNKRFRKETSFNSLSLSLISLTTFLQPCWLTPGRIKGLRKSCSYLAVLILELTTDFYFSKVGLLTLDRPPYDEMSKVITNVRNVGQECVQMTAEEIVKRFPGLTVPPEECGALETTSGYIVADLALRCLQV